MDVSENSGFFLPPKYHPFKNRVFHEINHPLWGFPLFLETPKWKSGNTPRSEVEVGLPQCKVVTGAPSKKSIGFQANFPSVCVNEDGTTPPNVEKCKVLLSM